MPTRILVLFNPIVKKVFERVGMGGVAVHDAGVLAEPVVMVVDGGGFAIGIGDVFEFSCGVVPVAGDDAAGVGAFFEFSAGGVVLKESNLQGFLPLSFGDALRV